MFWKKRSKHVQTLAELLAYADNRDTFLGVKNPQMPTPKDIRDGAAKLVRYSNSQDYLGFAQEVWGRVLNHLDIILDDKSTDDKVKIHRGALKEDLDLLRLSHQARQVVNQYDGASESLPH